MMKKILILFLLVVLLNSPSIHAQVNKNVELYNIQLDTVTKTVPTGPTFQKMAEEYLRGIDHVYVKVRPIPREGFMVKIPLEPAIEVKNEWLVSIIDEIIIIFPEGEEPYLMVFDDENSPHFFTFKGNKDILVKTFNLKKP